MPKLERDHWTGACNEPQPYNWKHACQRKPGHRGEHRVNKGDEDITWTGDGPVEILPAKSARAYISVGDEGAIDAAIEKVAKR